MARDPNPWTDNENEGDTRDSGGGPDGGDIQSPPLSQGGGWSQGWADDFWQRMIKNMGVVQSDVAGNKEWGADKYGRVAMDPRVSVKLGTGWDTSQVWTEDAQAARTAAGTMPDWMQAGLNRFTDMKAAGQLSQVDLNALADHWVRGVGIDPVWKAAYDAQPEYISSMLKDFFRNLGATNV